MNLQLVDLMAPATLPLPNTVWYKLYSKNWYKAEVDLFDILTGNANEDNLDYNPI